MDQLSLGSKQHRHKLAHGYIKGDERLSLPHIGAE